MWFSGDGRRTEDTKRRLLAATDFVGRISFRGWSTTMSGWRMQVWSDPSRTRHEAIVAKGDDTLEARVVDERLFLRMSAGVNLPIAGRGWHELDRSRVPAGYTFSFGPPGKREPANAEGLIGTIVSGRLRRRRASGVVDMIKVGALGGLTPRLVQRPRSGHLQVPFQAELDGDGRLTSFHIGQTSNSPPITVLYADFGIDVNVSAPDDAAAAPDDLYPALHAIRRRRESAPPDTDVT